MKIMKKINSKAVITAVVLILIMVFLSSCADYQSVQTCIETGHQYGFWGGLWHGIIAPFDFVGMLIWDDVTMYAQNNNGAWYAFGFLLGVGGWGLLRWIF